MEKVSARGNSILKIYWDKTDLAAKQQNETLMNHSPVEPPSIKEVKTGIQSLRNNKTPGIDTILNSLR